MSKVWVDRELLERACMRPGRESLAVNDRDIIERGRAQAEIRELLAQPAEADGVEVLARGFFHALPEEDDYEFHDEKHMTGPCDGCVPAVVVSSAALSAVTAERDAARAELERAYVNYNQASYASTERGKERDQLRAEVEALNRAIKARLPGRGIAAVGTGALHAEQDYCYRRGWKEGVAALRAQIRAAMHAKEGGL